VEAGQRHTLARPVHHKSHTAEEEPLGPARRGVEHGRVGMPFWLHPPFLEERETNVLCCSRPPHLGGALKRMPILPNPLDLTGEDTAVVYFLLLPHLLWEEMGTPLHIRPHHRARRAPARLSLPVPESREEFRRDTRSPCRRKLRHGHPVT